MEADHLAGLSAKYRASLETTSLHVPPHLQVPQRELQAPWAGYCLPLSAGSCWTRCPSHIAGSSQLVQTNLERGKAKSAFRESWAQGDRLYPVHPSWVCSEVLGQENQGRPGLQGGGRAGPRGQKCFSVTLAECASYAPEFSKKLKSRDFHCEFPNVKS